MYLVTEKKCPYCGKRLTRQPSHKDKCKKCGKTYRIMPQLTGYPRKVIVTEAEAKVLKGREKTRKYRTQYPYGKFQHFVGVFRREIGGMFSDWLRKYPQPMNSHNELLGIRNKIADYFRGALGAIVQQSKHGISVDFLDISDLRHDFDISLRRKPYLPCDICGENRTPNRAHIVPSSEGGTIEEGNLLNLCANHHHLFDRFQLSRSEWEKIDFSKKTKAARAYAKEIILPRQKKFWTKVMRVKAYVHKNTR